MSRSGIKGSVAAPTQLAHSFPTVSQIHFLRSADQVSDTHQPCPSVEGGHPPSGSVLPDTRRLCYSSDNTLGGSRPVFRDSPPGPDPRRSEASVVGEQDPSTRENAISCWIDFLRKSRNGLVNDDIWVSLVTLKFQGTSQSSLNWKSISSYLVLD